MSDQQNAAPQTPNPTPEQVVTWSKLCEMDRVAAYSAQGRRHNSLSNEALIDKFKEAIRAFASEAWCEEKRLRAAELESEFILRGLVVPFDEVSEALERLIEHTREALARIAAEDPQRLAQIEGKLATAVNSFKTEKVS